MFTLSIFNLFIWKYKQQTIVFRFWHHSEWNWSLKWAMCFCFVKELNCFTNHYFSLPFSSEVFTESKVEVKWDFSIFYCAVGSQHPWLRCPSSLTLTWTLMLMMSALFVSSMRFRFQKNWSMIIMGTLFGTASQSSRHWHESWWGKADLGVVHKTDFAMSSDSVFGRVYSLVTLVAFARPSYLFPQTIQIDRYICILYKYNQTHCI